MKKNFQYKTYKIIEASDSDFFDNTIRFTIPDDNFSLWETTVIIVKIAELLRLALSQKLI